MRHGFTLIELLIVMAILAVMMAVIVPSMSALPSTQVSMAAKDSLRLMRYARNMALQTQQPMTLTFSSGAIALTSEHDRPTTEPKEALDSDSPKGTSAKDAQFAVDGGGLDEIGLKKNYDAVAFEFLGYNDTLTTQSSGAPNDLQRRTITSSLSLDGKFSHSSDDTPFSITVRANGTTRPFSIRVYERDNEDATGDVIAFDFLCSGVINDDE